jgi:translation initiation factor IF-3
VIGPEGQPLGVLPIQEALGHARRAGLDLVEVSPNARPPVCKILDFGKFRYEASKRDRDSRKHNVAAKVKELKFHINIDEHDYMVKMRQAERFMFKGMKVKIAMVFRGREMQHQEIGKELVKRIRADLLHIGTADAEPKLIGKNINMMLTPLPEKKRVRKFTEEHDIDDESDDVEHQ